MTGGIGFGAAYYTEYQRCPDIEADFSLMAKAGFSMIRVGESVWSTWEPQDGSSSAGSNRSSTRPSAATSR
jgi:beta-galactosidase GanA